MRYRKLDPNLDYQFGSGLADFWVDKPEGVGQYVMTRLMLWEGTWFYDLSQGVPWATEVLGERTQGTRDVVVRESVNDTPGVADIAEYASIINPNTRAFSVAMIIDTIYGAVAVGVPGLPGGVPVPPLPGTVPPLPYPPGRAGMLGVRGNPPPTDLTMNRADLTQPGEVNISDFVIRAVDASTF